MTTTPCLIKLTLFSAKISSSSARVRTALNLKAVAIPVVINDIDFLANGHKSPSYLLRNPNGSVPTLVAEYDSALSNGSKSFTITQSLAILDFIEQNFPEPAPLIPSDPVQRARVMELSSLVIADIQPPQASSIRQRIAAEFGGDGKVWAKGVHDRGLSVYETLLARYGTETSESPKFSVGNNVTLADVCLVPTVQAGLRDGIDLNQWPLVKNVVEHCWELKEFRDSGIGGHGNLIP
ncbi:glutathione S-transferase [Mycena floridula]|nr:glutathione S-transferase [Mycena floridula]